MEMPNFAEIKWNSPLSWHYICDSEDVPINTESGSSEMFLAGDTQIAVYRFPDNRLFASQNMCGHRKAFILSEGTMEIDGKGSPSISCPMHRRKFALNGDRAGYTNVPNFKFTIATFLTKEEDGKIYVELPDISEMDSKLGTRLWSNSKSARPCFISRIGSRKSANPLLDDGGPPKCTSIDSRLTW